jgi:hypothetical protein
LGRLSHSRRLSLSSRATSPLKRVDAENGKVVKGKG